MTISVDTLERLLPAIYRVRDAEGGGELHALLDVLAESMARLDEDIEQLYDDQFIETASAAAVPFIGTLVGARVFSLPVEKDESPSMRNNAATRAQVANAIRARRARGTAAALEQVARDITGWDVVVVEFFQRLATTQALNHLRPGNVAIASTRNAVALDRIGTPFESVTRTLDVRRIATGRGTHNIPNIGVFLWPFRSQRLRLSPAVPVDDRRFLFHPLGIDTALRTNPDPERDPAGLARAINVPLPISRRVFREAVSDYYGVDRSLFVEVDGVLVESSRIVAADLSNIGADDASGWSCDPPSGHVAIDPVLGRIAFSSDAGTTLPTAVRVGCHIGHTLGIGGGAYERAESFRTPGTVLARVPTPVTTLAGAVVTVLDGGTVEIINSDRYEDAFVLAAANDAAIELRGANEQRPHLALPADLEISGDGAEVFLDGLLVSDAAIIVRAGVARVHIRHCTLVPGRSLTRDGLAAAPALPSLVVEGTGTSIEIESSIVGRIQVAPGSSVRARYSVLDATADDRVAFSNAAADGPGGALTLEQCTVVGTVWTEALNASNSIFTARLATADPWTSPLRSERRQEGCVRFSYVPPGAVTPRRHRCQPDAGHPDIVPRFRSLRFGRADYIELAHSCPREIAEGGEDGGEMGALVRLRLRQRDANLHAALPEQLRFGLEAGTFVSHE